MMIKEAEDNAGLDEIRRREEEKVFKARDDALKAREDAREHLMKLVDQGRQEQIKSKHDALLREREEEALRARRFIEDARDGIEKERNEAEYRRNVAVQNNAKLQEQIEYRRHREELEKQETYLADKHMHRIERLHKQRLAEQAGSVRSNFPVKASQWYT